MLEYAHRKLKNKKVNMTNHFDKTAYKLFIDELGHTSYKHPSPLYILSCCSVDDLESQRMKIRANQIKFKYWGHTDIIFHSREIGRKDGKFAILKDKDIYKSFLQDLESFLLESKFKMFFAITNKDNAKKSGWDEVKTYKETANVMIRNFILILLSHDSRGEIVIESATATKDFYFHRALGHFLSDGLIVPKVSYKKVQETITSISFVSKKNHDIEEQIADLLAYAIKCKSLKKKIKKNSYEDIILKILNKKLFRAPRNVSTSKKKFLDKVEVVKVLP